MKTLSLNRKEIARPMFNRQRTQFGMLSLAGSFFTLLSGQVLAAPQPIVDSNFYTEPTPGIIRDLVAYYGVDNTDDKDDSALLQQAIDDISTHTNGGKLIIPSGDYYLLNVQLKSNVHLDFHRNATIYPTFNDDGRNHRIFEAGTFGSPGIENVSIIGRGKGFTVDFRETTDSKLAVFNLGDIRNFKISNINIQDNKTIFASFLVNVSRRGDDLYWPHNGIIENINQYDSLFGYGLVQTYGADNVLFRNLHSEGGVALRMETDNLVMKELGQGGIRDIFAEDISCENGLAAVMFSPHFIDNGSVQVNGVHSRGCGFTVRVDRGFVELFSPLNYTRQQWAAEVRSEVGSNCVAFTYSRAQGTRWAARIADVDNCLEVTEQKYHLTPGTYEESFVYNVTSEYGESAHLKQDQLGYITADECSKVCKPSYNTTGQIYHGPSIAAIVDKNVAGRFGNYIINVTDPTALGYPTSSVVKVDINTPQIEACGNNRPICP